MTDLADHVNHALRRHRTEPVHDPFGIQPVEQLHHVIERPIVGDAKVEEVDGVW